MSEKPPSGKVRGCVIGLLVALLCIMFPGFLLLMMGLGENKKGNFHVEVTSLEKKRASAQDDVHFIAGAIRIYSLIYGDLLGGDYAEIIGILHGKNPRQIDFLKEMTDRIPADEIILDPWDRPYVIASLVGTNPKVYCVGENGIDEKGAEKSDDVVCWR